MKLTRRQLVIAAAAGSTAVNASAQPASTPAPSPAPADRVRQNADTLAKFAIPITTEPAFQFKA